jgi:isopenicillin N synthase-like dioxygenase
MVVGDYKEGYYIGVEVPEDDPKAEKPFYGPNVWPSDGISFFSFVSDSVVFIQETCLISSRMLKLFIENFLLFSWLVS